MCVMNTEPVGAYAHTHEAYAAKPFILSVQILLGVRIQKTV